MDEYIVKKGSNGKGHYFYYKNGKLHREAGPAVEIFAFREKYKNLVDEHVYKEELMEKNRPDGYQTIFLESSDENGKNKISVAAYYYLEGQPYSEKEFEIVKAKNDLTKELANAPVNPNNKNKKAKL